MNPNLKSPVKPLIRLHLLFALLVNLVVLQPAKAGNYTFSVKGPEVLINKNSFKVIGLRTSNALISDDTANQLIQNLDIFKSYGVNTVSVFVMGSHFGNVKGYKPDASMDPVYAARLGKIIEAADQRGMIVLVGCLYFGHSESYADLKAWTQEDANKAVANTVAWLGKNNYRNVFVDVDNEGMAHASRKWEVSKMIDAAHAVDPTFMVANNCPGPIPDNADLLVHYSFKDKDNHRPWIQSEGVPDAPGYKAGYWGEYSLGKAKNYIRIGRYTAEMKKDSLELTFKAIEKNAGYMLASTWLQCVATEGAGGPHMTPGGLAENPNVDESVLEVQKDAGILWWLQAVKEKYGPWNPPVLSPRAPGKI